jgi:hypothetical protein
VSEIRDGNFEATKLRQVIRMASIMELLQLNFKEEINSMNFKYNMFSNIYFPSHICIKSLKLIHTITFSVQTCFLM